MGRASGATASTSAASDCASTAYGTMKSVVSVPSFCATTAITGRERFGGFIAAIVCACSSAEIGESGEEDAAGRVALDGAAACGVLLHATRVIAKADIVRLDMVILLVRRGGDGRPRIHYRADGG